MMHTRPPSLPEWGMSLETMSHSADKILVVCVENNDLGKHFNIKVHVRTNIMVWLMSKQ